MFNEDGFFIPHSAKGCRALGYLWDTSRLLSINSEILNLIGFNFLDYKMRHGKKVKFAYEQLFKQYEDVTITNYIAEKAIGSFACGNKPYKTHGEFIKWQDKDGSGEWIPNKDNFINWSLRFVVENHPEWINDKLLDDIKVHWQLGAYFSIQPMEIYNANFAINHLDFWNKKLMEFEKRNIRFVLGIVPTLLTDEMIQRLKSFKHLILAQHGYNHKYDELSKKLIKSFLSAFNFL